MAAGDAPPDARTLANGGFAEEAEAFGLPPELAQALDGLGVVRR